jgi:hypothetical protein
MSGSAKFRPPFARLSEAVAHTFLFGTLAEAMDNRLSCSSQAMAGSLIARAHVLSRPARIALAGVALLAATGCRSGSATDGGADGGFRPVESGQRAESSPTGSSPRVAPPAASLVNRIAYIPPQCFTRTSGAGGAYNPCYTCHTHSEPPNATSDFDLQRNLSLPPVAAHDPWTNLFDPPYLKKPAPPDTDVLAYVRATNYFDKDGGIALDATLDARSPRWRGYRPDARFTFDNRGFDRRADGTMTGWRAFAYYPFEGTFFPTNGSADDVLIRLAAKMQQTPDGRFDRTTYEVNLAIVESLITRADVPIDPVDEARFGVDLDLDGHIGTASQITFDKGAPGEKTRMQYVGRANAGEGGRSEFPIAAGLFPIGTEFVHTVRYLDIGADGAATMAPRMKEVRYAKKVRWYGYGALKAAVDREAREEKGRPDHVRQVAWAEDLGIREGGWTFQGFIEDAQGALRPQTYEETLYCDGCHGGIGATTDSIFSFARKLSGPLARGWFHWSQHDLRGIPEPKRTDGAYEYTTYLEAAGAGDELRENTEVLGRFFDARGVVRPAETEKLHRDVAYLLLPSPARAVALDQAYRAIVEEQSFIKGREAVLAPSKNVYDVVPVGSATGITKVLDHPRLARASAAGR